MIGAIHGHVIHRDGHEVTIMTACGVGYDVRVAEQMRLDGPVTVFTWHVFNESAHQDILFGFISGEERDLAKLAAETDGVGPGKAHKLVTMAGIPMILRAVQSGDISELHEATSGLGPKTLRAVITTLKASPLPTDFCDPRVSVVRLALSGLGLAVAEINSRIDQILLENPTADPSHIVKLLLDTRR